MIVFICLLLTLLIWFAFIGLWGLIGLGGFDAFPRVGLCEVLCMGLI